jgi:hypothetical protein
MLLTKYKKNNSIRYGYVIDKIEYGENIGDCAAREVS